jgi:hypothetical protein
MKFPYVTLASLKRRSGLRLRDGSHIQYVSYHIDGTIHQAGKRSAGVFHQAQERYGIQFFTSFGYKIFPRHIGIRKTDGWADFAVARYSRVILVECMTDWWVHSTIHRKSSLATACELWFIAQSGGVKELRAHGYNCKIMPCPDCPEWRDLKTTFWICKPKDAKNI